MLFDYFFLRLGIFACKRFVYWAGAILKGEKWVFFGWYILYFVGCLLVCIFFLLFFDMFEFHFGIAIEELMALYDGGGICFEIILDLVGSFWVLYLYVFGIVEIESDWFFYVVKEMVFVGDWRACFFLEGTSGTILLVVSVVNFGGISRVVECVSALYYHLLLGELMNWLILLEILLGLSILGFFISSFLLVDDWEVEVDRTDSAVGLIAVFAVGGFDPDVH